MIILKVDSNDSSKQIKNMTTATRTEHIQFSWIRTIKYEHLIAGVSGGLAATLILHPLDLIRIRLSVDDNRMVSTPNYGGTLNALKTIFKEEGFFGLYRGVIPNCIGAGSSWGLYFLFYNGIKFNIQEKDTSRALSAGTHLLAATEAGFITLVICNPIWLVKTRMCLQYSDKTQLKSKASHKYNGVIDALTKIYKNEGIRGYYKGFVPALFGISHGAVQFMTYDELKNRYTKYKNLPINVQLTTAEYLCFAAFSKIVAVGLTYPYQVLRSRLQSQHISYSGTLDCIQKTWNYEGWRGFYKGLGTNIIRVTPATMITFITYENISYFLLKS